MLPYIWALPPEQFFSSLVHKLLLRRRVCFSAWRSVQLSRVRVSQRSLSDAGKVFLDALQKRAVNSQREPARSLSGSARLGSDETLAIIIACSIRD